MRGRRVHVDVAVRQDGAHGGGCWAEAALGRATVSKYARRVRVLAWELEMQVWRALAQCALNSTTATKRFVMGRKGPPPSNCNPVTQGSRPSSLLPAQQHNRQSRPRPRLRPRTHLCHARLPSPPPHTERRTLPFRAVPTQARHVTESTARWTPGRLPVRTVQARAARYAHGCCMYVDTVR